MIKIRNYNYEKVPSISAAEDNIFSSINPKDLINSKDNAFYSTFFVSTSEFIPEVKLVNFKLKLLFS